ncbi:MAG: CHC2 zinc finger domain-containing protein [Chloroflexi bacterium]|nr:CHC2 zinc finger domain-containing protein [Chloroflexota bacterium]
MFDTEAIRAAHPIARAVAGAGVELRRSGRHLVGLCPFHDDRTPSLVVYPESARWMCFSCDVGGDVIDFVGRMHGTAFRETAAMLAASAGAAPVPAPAERSPPRRPARVPDDEAAAAIEEACSLYAEQYARSREARSYVQGRGIDEETASRLRIGLAAGGLARRLRSRPPGPEPARRVGLLAGDRDALSGRIVVPDLDAGGRATWLTARSLDGREPRYLNLRLPSPVLGLAGARAAGARALVLTEGPFDWLTLCAWQLHGAALLGTHVSREALQALRSFRRVYLALDADDAGRRASTRLRSELGARAVVVPLPRGAPDLSELGSRPDGRRAFLDSLQQAHAREQESWMRQQDEGRRGRAA